MLLEEVFVVAPEPSEASFYKFLSIAGVYRSACFWQTGLFLIRGILFDMYRSAGFGQTGLFQICEAVSAYTGLRVFGRPVSS